MNKSFITFYAILISAMFLYGAVDHNHSTNAIELGSAGVRITGDGDGAFTILGLGDGSDEDITVNLDDTSDTAVVTSGTSLATINFSSIALQESGVGVVNLNEIDTSSELDAIVGDDTGSGALVFADTPTLVTPVIGVATGTSLALTGQMGSAVVTITVDGATTFAVTRNVINLECTDAEIITTITGGFSGQLLTILHEDSSCTINDTDDDTADQIDMLGSNNDLAGAADLVVQLVYTGAHWLAVSESAN